MTVRRDPSRVTRRLDELRRGSEALPFWMASEVLRALALDRTVLRRIAEVLRSRGEDPEREMVADGMGDYALSLKACEALLSDREFYDPPHDNPPRVIRPRTDRRAKRRYAPTTIRRYTDDAGRRVDPPQAGPMTEAMITRTPTPAPAGAPSTRVINRVLAAVDEDEDGETRVVVVDDHCFVLHRAGPECTCTADTFRQAPVAWVVIPPSCDEAEVAGRVLDLWEAGLRNGKVPLDYRPEWLSLAEVVRRNAADEHPGAQWLWRCQQVEEETRREADEFLGSLGKTVPVDELRARPREE